MPALRSLLGSVAKAIFRSGGMPVAPAQTMKIEDEDENEGEGDFEVR